MKCPSLLFEITFKNAARIFGGLFALVRVSFLAEQNLKIEPVKLFRETADAKIYLKILLRIYSNVFPSPVSQCYYDEILIASNK